MNLAFAFLSGIGLSRIAPGKPSLKRPKRDMFRGFVYTLWGRSGGSG
jgi:hypothetical protein